MGTGEQTARLRGTTFGTAKRDVHDGSLPCHQTCETASKAVSQQLRLMSESKSVINKNDGSTASLKAWIRLPPNVIQVDLGMITQTALEGTPAIVMLYPIRVEGLDLSVVLCDDKLNENLPLWCQ